MTKIHSGTVIYLSGCSSLDEIIDYVIEGKMTWVGRLYTYWDMGQKTPRKTLVRVLKLSSEDRR